MATQTVELKDGEEVYNSAEIEELFKQRDEALDRVRIANEKITEQRILINQAVKVVAFIQKLIPGLFNGTGISAISIPNIMNTVMNDKSITQDFEKLKKLMDEYQSKNAIPIKKD